MELQNGQFLVGGYPVLKLAEEFDTPLYFYDADKITGQHRQLSNAFAGVNHSIKYALKANSNLNILRLLKNLGAGLDAVSINEVRLGLKAGFAPSEILFTPNCVSIDEIREGVKEGVRINIDNISILEQFGGEFGNSYPVCIRINPHLLGGAHEHIQTGHIDSKFGISIHQIRHAMRVITTNEINVEGLHMHTGSDILDAQVFLNGLQILFNIANDFPDLAYLDFGSGFKVAYRDGDVTTNIEELGKLVTESFNAFCKDYGRDLELWFEPGKFLVSQAGYLLVKVNVVKQTVSTVFAGVDSGQNHLMRPMMYDAYHKITNVSNPGGVQRVYTVVGYICETDTFGADRKLPEVREGDLLVMHNAGAYGFSMSSNYNSRFRPAEILIHEGRPHLIRKRETQVDLLKNQVELDFLKQERSTAKQKASEVK
ncbi:MAG: diaminopimelate decarboxylase [Bacteroidia bacterium]